MVFALALAVLLGLAAHARAAPTGARPDASGASDAPGAAATAGSPGRELALDDDDDDLSAPPRAHADEPAGGWADAPGGPIALPLRPDEVVTAAYRAARLAHDPAPSWRTRTRLAALVPWVSVRDGRDLSWRDVDDPTLSHATVFDVHAVWHLDRLVFDQNELRIEAIEVARRRERRKLATYAVRLYFAWARAHSAELAAELDAITDGWFTPALAGRPGA